MHLSYIWINSYKNIENQGFNFDDEYNFKFIDNILSIEDRKNVFNNEFFIEVHEKDKKQIMRVKGIIGENGAGKSTILEFIKIKVAEILVENNNDKKNEKDLIIFRENDQLFLYKNELEIKNILNTTKWKEDLIINIANKENNVVKNKEKEVNNKIIYYSNIFDAHLNKKLPDIVDDISTNKMVAEFKDYRTEEIQNQLNFIISKSNINLPFKHPQKLCLKFTKEFYSSLIEPIQPENYYEFEKMCRSIFKNKYEELSESDGINSESKYNSRNGDFDLYFEKEKTIFEFKFKDMSNDRLSSSQKNSFKLNIRNMVKRIYERSLEVYKVVLVVNFFESDFNRMEMIEVIDKHINKYQNDSIKIKFEIMYWNDLLDEIYKNKKLRAEFYEKWNGNKINIINPLDKKNLEKVYGMLFKETFTEEQIYNNKDFLTRILLSYLSVFVLINTNHFYKMNFNLEKLCFKVKERLKNRRQRINQYILEFFNIVDKENNDFELKHNENKKYYKKLIGFYECLSELIKSYSLKEKENDDEILIDISKLNTKKNTKFLEKLINDYYQELNYIEGHKYYFLGFNWIDMSSGEKAMLNLYSRFYSLRNINNNKNILDVMILVDEGESYFHPQWQKKYFNTLLEIIKYLFDKKRVQLILTSNSPFIASDLPNDNIIFLDKEKKDNMNEVRTFAANIHSLYANSFFIRDGLLGEFAKNKVNQVYKVLNNRNVLTENQKKEIKSIINIIGEPVIRNKLTEMLMKKDIVHENIEDIDKKIEVYKNEIKQLEEIKLGKIND